MTSKRHIPALPDSPHLTQVDEGFVLRGRSRGVGVPVPVTWDAAPPARVIGGSGDFKWEGGQLYITPTLADSGDEFSLTVEL